VLLQTIAQITNTTKKKTVVNKQNLKYNFIAEPTAFKLVNATMTAV